MADPWPWAGRVDEKDPRLAPLHVGDNGDLTCKACRVKVGVADPNWDSPGHLRVLGPWLKEFSEGEGPRPVLDLDAGAGAISPGGRRGGPL